MTGLISTGLEPGVYCGKEGERFRPLPANGKPLKRLLDISARCSPG